MSKNLSNQKLIVNDKIIHILISLSLASCNEKLCKDYDKELRFIALKSLCVLAGIYNRKIYIPGTDF